MDLAKVVETLEWEVAQARLLEACQASGLSSDDRFEAAFRAAVASQRPLASATEPRPQQSFRVDKKPGVIRIRFDEANLPADMVEKCLSRVRDVCSSFGVKS